MTIYEKPYFSRTRQEMRYYPVTWGRTKKNFATRLLFSGLRKFAYRLQTHLGVHAPDIPQGGYTVKGT